MSSIEKRIDSLYKQYADSLTWVKFKDGELKCFTEKQVCKIFNQAMKNDPISINKEIEKCNNNLLTLAYVLVNSKKLLNK